MISSILWIYSFAKISRVCAPSLALLAQRWNRIEKKEKKNNINASTFRWKKRHWSIEALYAVGKWLWVFLSMLLSNKCVYDCEWMADDWRVCSIVYGCWINPYVVCVCVCVSFSILLSFFPFLFWFFAVVRFRRFVIVCH